MDIQNLIDMVDEVVLVFDAAGTITMGNAKIDEWLPVSREEMIGKSDAINLVRRQILQAAGTEGPVMITGESGTGKEVVARAIYKNSRRADKPCIAINCGAIPGELMETELFGYEDGAFTGARKGGKKGLLEAANGGTVFLDEIGTMPKYLQMKLLRVIQENKLMRVGGVREIDLDVRYISATNLTLARLHDEAYFRQDLYYRLCVFPIQIPPLRQRGEDAELLAESFLEYFNKRYMKYTVLTKEVRERIRTGPWPGNVRELRNIMERLVKARDRRRQGGTDRRGLPAGDEYRRRAEQPAEDEPGV